MILLPASWGSSVRCWTSPLLTFFASEDDLAVLIVAFHRLAPSRKRRLMGTLQQIQR
jgi:hypothetical protein